MDMTSPVTRRAARQAALDSAKCYIAHHLDYEMSIDSVCRHLGCSRATVYRLFEGEGGLSSYIQAQRLQRALRALLSPEQPRRRILDIALDNHFASDATFTRAFSRTFGVPPAKLRAFASLLR